MLRTTVRQCVDAGALAGRSGSRTTTLVKIGCRSEMSKPKRANNYLLFDHNPNYVLTPTYDTREELDEAVQKLHREAFQRGYKNHHMPQRVFLKTLGVREPVGSKEYRNDVLLDTGTRHMVRDSKGNIRYWYMQYKIEKTNRINTDRPDHPENRIDLNTYVKA